MVYTLRNIFGWLVANVLIISGVVKRARNKVLNRECIISIYFHKPSKNEFENCIKWLKKSKFNFVSTPDIERIIQKDIPFPKGGVLLTVDDGWQSNEANVIEVAARYQIPVTIFISTSPVEEGTYWWSHIIAAKKNGIKHVPVQVLKEVPNNERLLNVTKIKKELNLYREAMTIDQVKNAGNSKFITIGGHTHTHPILINCEDELVYDELIISKQKLETWTGKEVCYFAYPNGDYSPREIKMLEKLKYRLAFSSHPEYITPEKIGDTYLLPRFGFLEGASFAENICRIVGVWQPLMSKFSLKRALKHQKTGNEPSLQEL